LPDKRASHPATQACAPEFYYLAPPMVDLKFNYPSLAIEAEHISQWMRSAPDPKAWLGFPPVAGGDSIRTVARKWMNLDASVSDVVLANSGNHALTVTLDALNPSAGIITDAYTYPAFKHSATAKNIALHVAASDHEGLTVAGIEEAFSRTQANVVYLQPTIHNPTCAVMSLTRRRAIAEFVRANNMIMIEDDAYRFLHPAAPPAFLEILPSHTIHIHSLSKPFNPLLKTAFIALPHAEVNNFVNCIRLTSSGNSSMINAFTEYLIVNGIIDELMVQKRIHAQQLQERVLPELEGISIQTHPNSFHLWLQLKPGAKSSKVSAALGEAGILIPTGPDFETVSTGAGERHLRVALAAERNEEKLRKALRQIRQEVL
jgi:DNA-binding transcriptional MocR family regulator